MNPALEINMPRHICSLPSCLFIYLFISFRFTLCEWMFSLHVCLWITCAGACPWSSEGGAEIEIIGGCDFNMWVLAAEAGLSAKATSAEPSFQLLPAGGSYQHQVLFFSQFLSLFCFLLCSGLFQLIICMRAKVCRPEFISEWKRHFTEEEEILFVER